MVQMLREGTILGLPPLLTPYQINVVPTRDHWSNDYGFSSDLTTDYSLESFGKDGLDGSNITIAQRFDFDLDIVLSNGQFVAAPE